MFFNRALLNLTLALSNTVKPRSTVTRLIRPTPRYYGQFYGQFCCFTTKSLSIFSKLTRLLRTPVNTDNGHFSLSRVTNSYTSSTPLYGHCLSAYCLLLLSRLLAGRLNDADRHTQPPRGLMNQRKDPQS